MKENHIICSRCQEAKPTSAFHKNASTSVNTRRYGFSYYCRDCTRTASKENYEKDKSIYATRTRRAKQKRIIRNYNWLQLYLLDNPCKDCGEADPMVLEFDHIGQKNFNISDAVRGGSDLMRIQNEITLCEVVCANCHRRRTAQRAGWNKLGCYGT